MREKSLHIAILFTACFVLCWLLFGDIFFHPNQYLFGRWGDGIKNYFTVLYYVLYDSGVHFTGMNYPFSEHVVFTDNQPLISFLLNFIHTHVTDISGQIIGILNELRFVSLFLGCLFLYLILKKMLLPGWYAILVALILGFLAPQFNRLTAHYSLSYFFFVPGLWYFLIRFYEQKLSILWASMIAVYLMAFSLIHPYYLMIGVVFSLVYLAVYLLQYRNVKAKLPLVGLALASALIPLIFFQVFMSLTDPVTDRPESPYGFFNYTASFESVFLPMYAPFLDVWNYFIDVKKAQGEGQAYVGFTGLIILILSLIKFSGYIANRSFKHIFKPVLPSSLPTALWTGVIVLLFSMGFPFKLGLDFLLDCIPPLKQFRSLGRFAWVFYYTFTVFCAFFIYQAYKLMAMRQLKIMGAFLVFLALFSWSLSAYNNVEYRIDYIRSINDGRVAERFVQSKTDQLDVTFDRYQAILAFPFFHVGSEEIGIHRSDISVHESMRISLSTGLPLVNSMMSRTSITQSQKIIRLLDSTAVDKEWLQDLPNKKPLLLITTQEDLTKPEQALVEKAQLLERQDGLLFYALPLSAFQTEGNN